MCGLCLLLLRQASVAVYCIDKIEVVTRLVGEGVPVRLSVLLNIFIIAPILEYITMPFTAWLMDGWLNKPRSQHYCEPLRSFEDGLCPFTPSTESQAKDDAMATMQEEIAQLRLRLDRRVSTLEHWAVSKQTKASRRQLDTLEEEVLTGSTVPAEGSAGLFSPSLNQDLDIHYSDFADHFVEGARAAGAAGAVSAAAASVSGAGSGEDKHAPGGEAVRMHHHASRRAAKPDEVSVIIHRRIRPGQEPAYEQLLARMQTSLATTVQGSLGLSFVRPSPGDRRNEYTIISKFKNYRSMQEWKHSQVRAQLLQEMDALSLSEADYEYVTGIPLLHSLFNVPSPFGAGGVNARPPPKWKVTLMTSFSFLLSIIWLSEPWSAYLKDKDLPEFIAVVIGICPAIFFTIYVVAPVFGWALARWLNSPRAVRPQPLRFLDDGFESIHLNCCRVARKVKVHKSGYEDSSLEHACG